MVRSGFATIAVSLISTMAFGSFTTLTFSGDSNATNFIVPGSEAAVAEARYGNNAGNGDWEVGVGEDTQQPALFNLAQRNWTSGTTEPFTLSWDGTTLDFTVGNTAVSYGNFPSGIGVDDLAIRAASGDQNESALTNLAINGTSVGIDNIAAFAGDNREYLVIFDVFSAPFTMTGDLTFSWSGGLAGSLPSAQIKIVSAVPEPSSILLVGLAGLGALRRR